MEPGSQLTESKLVEVETQAQPKKLGNTKGPGSRGRAILMTARGGLRQSRCYWGLRQSQGEGGARRSWKGGETRPFISVRLLQRPEVCGVGRATTDQDGAGGEVIRTMVAGGAEWARNQDDADWLTGRGRWWAWWFEVEPGGRHTRAELVNWKSKVDPSC